ncbi:MAG TPA: hypothetical protein VES68_03275 [Candidatus Sulfotelmatobacter sp.]|nr:hypothetical protein [Candidatus Sulfotelmatobacter sp.]
MTETDNSGKIVPDLTHGPFVVNLRIPNSGTNPEWRGRFILGGGENARIQTIKSIDEINQLPDGLNPEELRKTAGEIFSANGLLRVDF